MIYNGITREAFTAIQQRLQAETGVVVNTDEGQVTEPVHILFLHGTITISWVYTEADQTLVVGPVSPLPKFITEAEVETALTKLVEGA